MGKFYCTVIMVGLLAAGIAGPVQRADASKEKMYVSNRIKIVRPAASGAQGISAAAPDTGVQAGAVSPPADVPVPDQPMAVATADKPADTTAASVEPPSVSVPPSTAPAPSAPPGTALAPSTEAAPPSSEAAVKTEFASLLGVKEKYYTRKGRIDPFEPFLRKPEPETPVDQQEQLTRRVPRTPLEKIDLSQLRLTGVLRAESKTRALVQETSGKGYIVDEGTYIGNKGGQVAKILKDRITVSEKALDVFGKITVVERELKLQP